MSRKPADAVKQAVNILRRAGFSVIVAQNDEGDWLIHAETKDGPRVELPQHNNMRARLE